MALNFSGSADRVDHGNDSSLINLDPITVLAWVYPTSLAVAVIVDKRTLSGDTGYRLLYTNDTVGSLAFHINRASQDCFAWQFVGGTLDTSGANGDQKLFRGTLSGIAVEPSYDNQTVGSGTVNSDSGNNQFVGNRVQADASWSGYIGWVGIWNRQLSLGEVITQQFRPHLTSGCVLFTHYGFNGTGTQPDWSGTGNSGTVTGATQIGHVPIMPSFGISMPWTPAPAVVAVGRTTKNTDSNPLGLYAGMAWRINQP
jgi:hypothetical protein